MEKYTMFMDRKNQYSENEYTTKAIYRFSAIPIRISLAFFTKLEKNFKICMETLKASDSQSSLEKDRARGIWLPDLKSILGLVQVQ